ncbi:MAG: SDR family oxidoreductase [Candidatus Promineifilaceae bacterium]
MKQALVTGGAGFIGSHLVAALVKCGVRVRVLDDFSTGHSTYLAGLPVKVVRGDVADADVVNTAVSGCDTIFHLAALVSVPQSIENPTLNHQSNVTGFFNVLEAARKTAVQRVVYSSSAAVYGNLPHLPKQETSPTQPITPYAAAKLINEMQAAVYYRIYGLQAIGLRYMNVFGPRQHPTSPYSGVLSIFCRAAVTQQNIVIYGDGTQTRDFVYVDDVVAANLAAGAVPFDPETAVFNIGRGEQTSLNQIVQLLERLTKRPLPVIYTPPRPGDIKHSAADITLAQKKLGWQPQTPLEKGLRHTLQWLQTL